MGVRSSLLFDISWQLKTKVFLLRSFAVWPRLTIHLPQSLTVGSQATPRHGLSLTFFAWYCLNSGFGKPSRTAVLWLLAFRYRVS
jgi:hypothetical protein